MDQKIVCCHKVRISMARRSCVCASQSSVFSSAASAYKVILGALVSSSSRPYSANQSTSLRRPQCYGPKRIRYIDTHRRLILALTSSGSASGSRSTGHADDTNADGDLDINAPGPSAPPAAAAALGRRQRGRAVVDNTLDRGLEARDTSGVAAVVRRSKTTSIPGAAALEQGVPASASNEDSRRDVAASAKYGATGGKSLRLDPDVKAAAEAATDGSMHTVPPPSRPVVMDQTGAGSRSGGGGLLSRLARGKGAATVPPRRSRGRADSNGIGKGDDGGGNSRRSTIRSPSGGSSNPLSPDLPNNVSQVSNTATVASTDNEAGIHLDVTSEGFLDGSDTLPVALTAAAAAAVTVEVEAMAATTPLLTPASPPPAPSPDGFMAREDRPASSATILTGTSNNSSGSSSSSSSNTRGAGGSGSTSGGIRVEGGVIDPLVARLARVVAYVERELLGDTRGVAAATAVAAVHPDVSRLPPPSPPASALQPLELFAEAPITGRLLAKAAAEAAPQREVSSAPGTDEWKLLGGPTPPPLLQLAAETRDAVPNHLSGISNESDFGSSGTGQGAGGQSGGDSDSDSSSSRPTALVADELFRAREQEQLRYKSYLRQFVLRTAPAGSTGRASSGRADGVDDNRGEQMRKQQRRQQQQQRGQRSQTKSKEMVEPIDGNLSLTTEGGNSTSELQRALFGEIASTSDWLQLRTLLNVARETNYLDLSIVAAVFKQAADLLIEVEGGGTGPEGSGRLSVQSFARSNGVIIGTFAGGGGGGGGSGGGTVDDSGSPLMTPASLATAFGPAEVEAYGIFCSQLTAAATRALGRRQAPKKSGGLGADADGDHAGSGHDVAQIAYGMGVLQLRSRTLYDTVLRVSGEQLLALTARRTAAAATTAAAAAVLVRGGSTANGRATASGPTVFAEMAAAASAAATGGGAASTETAGLLASRQHGNSTAQPPPPPKPWTPSDIAYLAWGIALSYGGSSAAETSKDTADTAAAEAAQSSLLPLPDKAWLRALCNASIDSLAICAPTLMWRLLWSMARLSYVPPEEWMRLFLDRVRNSLADFEPQELCRIAWSLGALEVVPDKLWMRALVGQLHNRLRDLTADQLVSLYGALARLGYAPRPEVGSGFHAAAVRLMPLMSGSQLAALAYYAASFDRWRPSASFLEALARAARPHAASFSSAEASRLLWAWSRSASQKQQVLAASPPQQELQPQQRPQLQPQWQPQQQGAEGELLPPQLIDVLLARVLNGMRAGTTDGNDLSMTLWALAVMRRIPGAEWMAAWWRAAADPRVAASFDDTCVAQSLWAAAQLRTLAGPVEEASMYGSIDGDGGDSGGDPSQPPPQAAAAAAAAAAVAAMLSRMSGLLRRTSTANLSTTIAALADLQYRPSDAWMTLFAAEARKRLGSETAVNEDHGFIAYGLAVLGWPLEGPWVRELAAGGYRRMAGMSGEALGLLLWGLSQYGWSTDSKRFWDTVFRETGAKWDSCSARSVVLLYCAVADMLPPDTEPPLQWQRQLARSLRLRVPRPPAAALIPAALRAAAGGCLGPSLLRLRGAAAVAALTPGGLHVNLSAAAAAATSGVQRTRRSALDESLWSSLVYGANLYGDLGTSTGLDREGKGGRKGLVAGRAMVAGRGKEEEDDWGEEEEVLGPDFPEEGLTGEDDPWDGEAGWGGDPSAWEIPGESGDLSEGEEDADDESDEDYYERLLQEMYDDGAEDWAGGVDGGGRRADNSDAQQQQTRPQQQSLPASSSTSPYVFDPRMHGPDPVDPYGLLSGGRGSTASRRRNTERRVSDKTTGNDEDGDDDSSPEDEVAAFELPLPPELIDPRDHQALAVAVSELRVWWAHDIADELRWLWGFPGALRQLPPWVRQASLARLRKMMMTRRRR